jgi:uncharacterized membrane protein
MMRIRFLAVTVLCFVMGGYFMLTYAGQVYTFSMRGPIENGMVTRDQINLSGMPFENNMTGMPGFRDRQTVNPLSTNALVNLFGGVVLVIAGFSILYLTREKEVGLIREEVESALLLPEERDIMEELKKAGGEMTQKELSARTGIQKVKLHRLLSRLEGKNVVKRYPYGMTKKVVIERVENKA